jgi:hypothetical protein
LTIFNFSLCEAYSEGEGTENSCKYGAQCVEAHGLEELTEWKERFEYRRMKLQRASENKLYGKSYTEQLLERYVIYKKIPFDISIVNININIYL